MRSIRHRTYLIGRWFKIRWIKLWLYIDRSLTHFDPSRVGRIPLDRRVPWVPNWEEVLNGRDREEYYIPRANHQEVGYDGLREAELRDAVHEEVVHQAERVEGEAEPPHVLF
jgi:hypothetical protein